MVLKTGLRIFVFTVVFAEKMENHTLTDELGKTRPGGVNSITRITAKNSKVSGG